MIMNTDDNDDHDDGNDDDNDGINDFYADNELTDRDNLVITTLLCNGCTYFIQRVGFVISFSYINI